MSYKNNKIKNSLRKISCCKVRNFAGYSYFLLKGLKIGNNRQSLLLEQILYVAAHFLSRFYFSCAVYNRVLFRFGKSGKLIQDIRMLCQLHRESDGKFLIIYHSYHPEYSMHLNFIFYFSYFSRNLWMIVAHSARVALPCGSRTVS